MLVVPRTLQNEAVFLAVLIASANFVWQCTEPMPPRSLYRQVPTLAGSHHDDIHVYSLCD